MTVIRLIGSRSLALRGDVEPGEHCRLLIAGPLEFRRSAPSVRTEVPTTVLNIAYWSEPNPQCENCGHPV